MKSSTLWGGSCSRRCGHAHVQQVLLRPPSASPPAPLSLLTALRAGARVGRARPQRPGAGRSRGASGRAGGACAPAPPQWASSPRSAAASRGPTRWPVGEWQGGQGQGRVVGTAGCWIAQQQRPHELPQVAHFDDFAESLLHVQARAAHVYECLLAHFTDAGNGQDGGHHGVYQYAACLLHMYFATYMMIGSKNLCASWRFSCAESWSSRSGGGAAPLVPRASAAFTAAIVAR